MGGGLTMMAVVRVVKWRMGCVEDVGCTKSEM